MLTCITEAHQHKYTLPQICPPFTSCCKEWFSCSIYTASNCSHTKSNVFLPLFKPHVMYLFCFLIKGRMPEVEDWNNCEDTFEDTNSWKNLDFNIHPTMTARNHAHEKLCSVYSSWFNHLSHFASSQWYSGYIYYRYQCRKKYLWKELYKQ